VTDNSIALACSSGLFIGTVATAFAGADKPPPLGFLWLVVILAAVCVGVFVRLKRHLAARRAGERRRVGRVGVEGMIGGAGLAVALAAIGGGEPSILVPVESRLLGLVFAAAVGAVLALAVWSIAVQMQARFGKT